MLSVRVTTITNIYFPCALLQTLLGALCKLLKSLNKHKAECIMSHSADKKSKRLNKQGFHKQLYFIFTIPSYPNIKVWFVSYVINSLNF